VKLWLSHFIKIHLGRSFCEPSIHLQSWRWDTFFILVAAQNGMFLVSWKHRPQNLGPQTKRKQFFTACLLRIALAKLALSIVLSPPLLSAPDGPALLCFASNDYWYIYLISPSHHNDPNNSEGCSQSLCWVNITWPKCTMTEYLIWIHFLPCFACPAPSSKNFNYLVRNYSIEVCVARQQPRISETSFFHGNMAQH